MEHSATIQDYNFGMGALVLMRNCKIEETHNKNMCPQYLGLLMVVSRNWGGVYILCKLDGSVLHWPVVAFQLISYVVQEQIPLPLSALNINTAKLWELEKTYLVDDDEMMPKENDPNELT